MPSTISGKIPAVKRGLYQGGYAAFGLDVVCFRSDVEVWRVVFVGQFDRLKVYPDGTTERYKGKDNFPATDTNDELRLRPNPERTKTVQQIFDWYTKEAISPGTIATRLRAMGIEAGVGIFNKQKVATLLSNPVYIGLPTWNKKGASRFTEFTSGTIQAVSDTKTGRNRAKSDYVQPDQPQFEPMVSLETFAKAQELKAERAIGKVRAANTAALWLRPFLRCGACGGTMHGSMNTARNRIIPSYFCSKYNLLGTDGCKCHRTQHALIEGIVLKYVASLPGKIDALLSQPAEVEISLHKEAQAFQDIACDQTTFRAIHGEQGTYGEIFDRVLPEILKQRDAKQAEYDKLMTAYADLPKPNRLRMNSKLEAVQAEIDDLEAQAVDLRQPFEDAHAMLQKRKQEALEAIGAINSDFESRAKTEALRGVIEAITLRHRYDAKGKAILEAVEILPVSGEVLNVVINGDSPGRDSRKSPPDWLQRLLLMKIDANTGCFEKKGRK